MVDTCSPPNLDTQNLGGPIPELCSWWSNTRGAPLEQENSLVNVVWLVKYPNNFVLHFVVHISSAAGDWCDFFTLIFQACFTGTGAIMWLPQCQWSNPEKYGKNRPLANNNTAGNTLHNYWYALYLGTHVNKCTSPLSCTVSHITLRYVTVCGPFFPKNLQ